MTLTFLAEFEQVAREDRIRIIKGLDARAVRALREARPEVKRITIACDLQRGSELVGELALVAEAPAARYQSGDTDIGKYLEVHLADTRSYGITLLLATGSTRHIDGLRRLAHRLTIDSDDLSSRLAKQAAVYRALELPFIEPELRRGCDEIAKARQGDRRIL